MYLHIGKPGSFGGVRQFADASDISPKKAQSLLQAIDAYTKFKPIRKRFPRRKTVAYRKFELMQADLADMQAYARQNAGFRYILVVIDVFSKYVFYIPVKNKTPQEVKRAFKKVFAIATPKFMQTDQGMEFAAKEMQRFFKKHDVRWYHTFSEIKAALAERQIRTLKERLERIFYHRGSHKYVDILQDLADQYNTTKHSRIGIEPTNVDESNEAAIFTKLYGSNGKHTKKPVLNIGDQVRVYRKKATFSKGYEKNWTDEVFTIVRIRMSHPPVYYLSDAANEEVKGGFYKEELNVVNKSPQDVWDVEKILKRRIRKDGTMEFYVKWMGYGNDHNSWVTEIFKK